MKAAPFICAGFAAALGAAFMIYKADSVRPPRHHRPGQLVAAAISKLGPIPGQLGTIGCTSGGIRSGRRNSKRKKSNTRNGSKADAHLSLMSLKMFHGKQPNPHVTNYVMKCILCG